MTTGLSQLTEARQLERLPEMPVGALTTGPYVIAGKVTDQLGTLETPYSNTEAVYYRYKLEEEYRDSDGDLRIRTLDSGARGGDFQLRDQTGSVIVAPGSDLEEVEWNLERTYRNQSGRRIYSEWALIPGHTARVIGQYSSEIGAVTFYGFPEHADRGQWRPVLRGSHPHFHRNWLSGSGYRAVPSVDQSSPVLGLCSGNGHCGVRYALGAWHQQAPSGMVCHRRFV